jgi:Putative Ig domain
MRIRIFSVICVLLLSATIIGCSSGKGSNPNPPATLTITTISPLTAGTINTAYSLALAATGGTAPYTWSIPTGALPKGLSLSSSGVISGTPTVAGSTSVTIQIADAESTPQTATLAATLVISDGTVSITTSSPLPQGTLNATYSTTLAASGGTSPYLWSITTGTLPTGLTLNSSTGVISGTPTIYGTFNFTVQATDSASTPQSVSAALELQISGGTLSITTNAIAAGQQGQAYSFQLTATGGIPPYTWSIDPTAPLPAGLTLSPSGLISGTPAGASNSNPGFIVMGSVTTNPANLNLFINPVASTFPDGTYTFVFSGSEQTNTITNPEIGIALDGTFTVQSGMVQSGIFDENTNVYPALTEQPISGGTVTVNTDGLGQLALTIPSGTVAFAFAAPASAALGKDSAIRLIGFGQSVGSTILGSGVLKPAQPNSLTTAIKGSYAFLLKGSTLGLSAAQGFSGEQQALACSIQTDGAGTITSGKCDSNLRGTLASFATVTGTYSVDSQSRGMMQITLSSPSLASTTLNYSFYQVSPSELVSISIDPPTLNVPLVAGYVLQQIGAPFSNPSLPATSVLQMNGLAPVGINDVTPDITLGFGTSDGNGNLTFTYDEFNNPPSAAVSSGNSLSLTYTVDPSTGRVGTTSTSGAGPTLYLIDSTRAWVLNSNTSASSGILELQTGGPFTNASFTGNYLGGSLPLAIPTALNEAGLIQADGNDNVIVTTDRTAPVGEIQYDSSEVLYQYLSGTYAVDKTGRTVVTTPDGITRIFYIVSPTKVAYLTNDTAGYLGSFKQ